MIRYTDLVHDILDYGVDRPDRTGVGTRSLFGKHLEFNLREGFPILTTKKVHFKSIVGELLWFLNAGTNVHELHEYGVSIWDEWADKNGDLGPIYGAQWRAWEGADGRAHDQIKTLLKNLKDDPYSRRHVVSAWNVGELDQMALAPCHCLFQFYVGGNDTLSCHLYQRSADVFLGVPFNISSYALLTHMLAQCVGLRASRLVISFGDVHLYENHIEQAREMLKRQHKTQPVLRLNPEVKDLFSFTPEDITLLGYEPHPTIKAEVAV